MASVERPRDHWALVHEGVFPNAHWVAVELWVDGVAGTVVVGHGLWRVIPGWLPNCQAANDPRA
jgi:hypothetical protein